MPLTGKRKQEYQRKWLAFRKSEWFKENGPCVTCGANENLELDHIDPLKKVSHRIWSWSWDRIKEETSKCQVLCKKCHKEKSNEQLKTKICVNGHDKDELGRDKDGSSCSECRRERDRKARKEGRKK